MTIILFSCISSKGEQPNEDGRLLNDQDLLLVIETEFQKDTLLKYMVHCAIVVCIWIQPTMLIIIIFIIPLLVLDDYQEGIPVAYAIFNMEDKLQLAILESI